MQRIAGTADFIYLTIVSLCSDKTLQKGLGKDQAMMCAFMVTIPEMAPSVKVQISVKYLFY
jgi:hypothetical protein